jgi:hypothetical protein
MADTPPEVMQQYRAMLLARSPEERLKIGFSMNALAPRRWRATRTRRPPRCAGPCSCASTATSSTRAEQ